jgi:hypothetical protein
MRCLAASQVLFATLDSSPHRLENAVRKRAGNRSVPRHRCVFFLMPRNGHSVPSDVASEWIGHRSVDTSQLQSRPGCAQTDPPDGLSAATPSCPPPIRCAFAAIFPVGRCGARRESHGMRVKPPAVDHERKSDGPTAALRARTELPGVRNTSVVLCRYYTVST